MKISLNWLNEFVDLKGIKIQDIVSRFSLTTAEIEGYEIKGQDIAVVVGEIKTCEKIEGSKKLSKLTVWDGKKNHQVVCGAPNVRVGLKVAFAPSGTKVGDIVLSKVKLAGVESCGMCLSGRELGISNDHDCIIEIDAKAKVGEALIKTLPFINDTIIEIDNKSITNRPDLWGHYGIARELAVIFGRALRPLETADLKQYDKLPVVPVSIESDKCLSYGAIRVENISRKQSSLEMQTRLFYLDHVNTHGFLVDLSNYVMLEVGQPNHAFDANKVGKISVGHLTGGTFTTLKDQEIQIDKEMLFIKSDNKPVGLAGIVGGKNSEIDATSNAVVFEFATFDSMCIRKTSTAIGLRTDASTRFEKSLDTNLNRIAAERMVYLLSQFDKAAVVASRFTYTANKETNPIKLIVDKAYTEKFCGVKFDWITVTMKLAGLGFAPKLSGDKLHVIVPTWRASKDVTMPVDIIEEIVRTYGYDNIVPVPPRVDVNPIAGLPQKKLQNHLKDMLSKTYACQEVHTYLWSKTPSELRVVNSFVKGCDYIRGNLVGSLLDVVDKNKANHNNIRIFEVGKVWNGTQERRHLAICIPSYQELAQIVRELFNAKFNIPSQTKRNCQDFFHPKNNAGISVNGNEIGFIGQVIGKNCAAASINLDKFTDHEINQITGVTKSFSTPSKYQKNHLDFTFEFAKGEHIYGDIETIFEKFSHPLNMGFKLKDIYENKYTLQFTVGSYEKTLTSDDINDIWAKIIAHGKKNGLTLKE